MSRVRPLMSAVKALATATGMSTEDAGFVLSRSLNARGDDREFDVWTMQAVGPNDQVSASEADGSRQSENHTPGLARPHNCSAPDTAGRVPHSPAQALRVLRAAQQCLAAHEARLLEGEAAAGLGAYVDILLAANDLAPKANTAAAPAEGGAQ